MATDDADHPPAGILTDRELACAQEIVRQHGFDAPIVAAIRADELMKRSISMERPTGD
jgi:hypothetical protein